MIGQMLVSSDPASIFIEAIFACIWHVFSKLVVVLAIILITLSIPTLLSCLLHMFIVPYVHCSILVNEVCLFLRPHNQKTVCLEEACAICLEFTGCGSKQLCCLHIFHQSCIERWNKIQTNCPLCRANILNVKNR